MSDTLPKSDRPALGYTQEDWDEVSDSPELTDEQLAELRPAREVPEVFNLLPKRGRGRPKLVDAKVNLTLRIEPALLDAYKATGAGWQVRMQEALALGLNPPAEPKPKVRVVTKIKRVKVGRKRRAKPRSTRAGKSRAA